MPAVDSLYQDSGQLWSAVDGDSTGPWKEKVSSHPSLHCILTLLFSSSTYSAALGYPQKDQVTEMGQSQVISASISPELTGRTEPSTGCGDKKCERPSPWAQPMEGSLYTGQAWHS